MRVVRPAAQREILDTRPTAVRERNAVMEFETAGFRGDRWASGVACLLHITAFSRRPTDDDASDRTIGSRA
jgi:hypothetical protein